MTCMVHDPLMLHTSDVMGIISTCTSTGNVLEGLLVMTWNVEDSGEDVVGM